MEYYLITFANTNTAMAAQQNLKGKLDFHIMPTLREISGSCGISIKIQPSALEEAKTLLAELFLSSSLYQFYHITGDAVVLIP